ncbi:proline iminopeptidase [Rhodofomes roseus]|uniref:Proline iminopeptidase n=1 Tax=Rhodofomes roseus TaxID=34475 RepID=A0ABQ8KXT7_9APHY|nr:proline iminopeptidase [Rhodofomes roseus]KAH9843848.1 proline iminopeptidase [Rhodofomes roseus]
MPVPVTEGFAPLSVPGAGKPCQTYYKIFGEVKSGVTPLIALHGGPGATMNYLLSLADLAEPPYDIPVVLYDQVGCGGSTLLPEKAGDVDFWTVQLFVDEFHNLMKHIGIETYDVLGHSWGSMLGLEIAVRQPTGLRRLILSSGLASMKLWEEATRKLLNTLPPDVVETINKHERAGTFDSPEYAEAMVAYNQQFVCRLDPYPPEVLATFKALEDPTVYGTMEGPSEFTITGSLKTWNITPQLPKITVPVLITNGAYDEAADSVIAPVWKALPRVKWYTFPDSSHMAQWEERAKFMQVIAGYVKLE